MNTFNWWTIAGPVMLLGAWMLGFLSVKRRRCGVYAKDISKLMFVLTAIASTVFTVMVARESYLGIVDFCLRHFVAEGESEVLGDACAIGALMITFTIYAMVFVAVCCVAADGHEVILRKQARKVRNACYNGRKDIAKLTEVRSKCTRASEGGCPVKLHELELVSAIDEKTGKPTMVIAERPRVKACDNPDVGADDSTELLVEDRIEETPCVDFFEEGAASKMRAILVEQKVAGKLQACIVNVPVEIEAKAEVLLMKTGS